MRARYEAAGQGHVFRFVDAGKVPAERLPAFLEQLDKFDLEYINSIFRETVAADAKRLSAEDAAAEMEALPAASLAKLAESAPADVDAWRATGLDAVARGELAALVLAGGQGTRLGFAKPKGEYNLQLPSLKTLFRVQADRILRVRALAAERAGKDIAEVRLPLYVMTSPMTDADTRAYFAEQKNFGLGGEDGVFFFQQGTLPCLTDDGKIMLESASKVAEAPDGNGGIYRGLHLSGAMAHMDAAGVKFVHAFAVDNAVCKVADPVFAGYCVANGADVGSKVCWKVAPEEAVGVLCKKGGRFAVVEYSDMADALKELRDESGELTYGAGNVCIHFYTTDFLREKCSPDALPRDYHLARKKIPYAHEETGETVPKSELSGNTGVKLESFIFDVFPASESMASLVVDRAAEFSPVKNAPGTAVDSPDSARLIFSELHKGWLAAAGAAVEGDALGEVSALVSYAGEGLGAFAGKTLQTPFLVRRADEGPFDPLKEALAAAGDGEAVADGVQAKVLPHPTLGEVNVYLVEGGAFPGKFAE